MIKIRAGTTVAALCVTLFALSSIYSVDALKCYQCNSYSDSACLGLPEKRNRTADYNFECIRDEKARNIEPEKKYPICRKVELKFLATKEHRIIRDCSWHANETAHLTANCFNADNEGYLERICHCPDDACNAANSVNILGTTLVFGAILSLLSHI